MSIIQLSPTNVWPNVITPDHIDAKRKSVSSNKQIVYQQCQDVSIERQLYVKLPAKFINVDGVFDCSYNRLTSLEGSPDQCTMFICSDNQLESLEHGPKLVSDFYCQRNKLTSLEYGPQLKDINATTGVNYNCSTNKITSLKGAPKIVGIFRCDDNLIESLEYSPQTMKQFNVEYNRISSLVDINRHIINCNNIHLEGNPIEEGGIGLLLINGLEYIGADVCGDFSNATVIINKYLNKHKKGLLRCQEELIEAGFEKYAIL